MGSLSSYLLASRSCLLFRGTLYFCRSVDDRKVLLLARYYYIILIIHMIWGEWLLRPRA